MNSRTTAEFWEQYRQLPAEIRQRARTAYQRFKTNPNHPSLRFKRVDPIAPLYSVRITDNYRAVGLVEGDTILWAFIGTHDAYERFLSRF